MQLYNIRVWLTSRLRAEPSLVPQLVKAPSRAEPSSARLVSSPSRPCTRADRLANKRRPSSFIIGKTHLCARSQTVLVHAAERPRLNREHRRQQWT
jgi:hypothetical protein